MHVEGARHAAPEEGTEKDTDPAEDNEEPLRPAKDAQAETEERITTIEAMLRTAKIADEDETPDEGVIATGRTVTLHDLIYDEEVTYKIVGNTEADPFNGKLSNASAVGQHLLGARAGDVLEFPVIDGTAKYKVLDVRK